ncbi:amidase [Rhizobium leguminosarum]|nr:amidase [Rhizobium leguminosarum]
MAAMNADLWKLNAATLSRAFSLGELSPAEVVDSIVDRIEKVNPKLNAIVTLDRGGALEAARQSERRWKSGEPLGPLDGVPLTVKDNIAVKGMRTTWGSRLFASHVPDDDELSVARLRAQGVVILGKTNAPEFTLQGYTDNPVFGPTRNPWDIRLTPGGSSGGAVAAVAAGLGPLAIATDGGGSIRRPASYTGLVGFKPSTGRIARTNGLPVLLHDFEVAGPIGRCVEDVRLLFSAISGPDPKDRDSAAFLAIDPKESPALGSLRILFIPRFGTSPVDPEIAESVAEVPLALKQWGHSVDAGSPPFSLQDIDRIWSVIGPAGLAWLLRGQDVSLVSPALNRVAENGAKLSAADYVGALDATRQVRMAFVEFFEQFDLIMTPSAAALPWPAEEPFPETIDGHPVGPRGHAIFTAFANVAGLPAISLPCRPSRSGLPIGFQLVAPFGADGLLLRMAAEYEKSFPWSLNWPPIE